VSLAAAKTEILQQSTSGAFANISTGLKAALIETVENFVMVADTSETTYGDSPDRWWCCAIRDPFDWTPSVSTQSATNTLVAVPGRITALRRYGENIIAYKLRGMFRGTYLGQPSIWEFPLITGAVGALSQEAVVDIGTAEFPMHAIMAEDDFYVFDGSRPRSIGTNKVRDAVFNGLNRAKQSSVIGSHDKDRSIVRWWYPTIDSANPNRCVVWNYRTNQWGRDDRQIEAAVEYIASGLTYDGLGSVYGTYASLPDAPYDSAFASADTPKTAYFDTSHVLKTLDGTPTVCSVTTGDLGGDNAFTLVDRLRMRFTRKPSSGSLTNYYRNDLGDVLTPDSGAPLEGSKFDFQREAKWHRFVMTFNGDSEFSGFHVSANEQGEE
jgi:hypothetical protein